MIPNFAIVDQGVPGVYRGGQPTTPQDWDFLKSLGVICIIKLNEGLEDDDWTVKNNVELLHVPESSVEQVLTEPDLKSLLTAVEFITPGTFIHCTHGEDRTGLCVGYYRVVKQGWSKDKAYAEMKAHGFHPELFGLDKAWADLPA